VIFLVMNVTHGGSFLPTSSAWTVPSIVCVAGVALLVALANAVRRPVEPHSFASARRSCGPSSNVHQGHDRHHQRVGASVVRSRAGRCNALIVGGVIGLLCEQAALHVGTAQVSQTFIVIVDPVVSVALGIWLYRERLHHGALNLTIGVMAFALMCAGIVALTRTRRHQ